MQETLNQQVVKTKRANIIKAKQARRRCIILFLSAVILCAVSFSVGCTFAKQPQEQNIISQIDQENQITSNEQFVSQSEQWNLRLVNPWNKISDNYKVSLTQLKNEQSVDERIYEDLQKMVDDCRAAGLSPLICSSFRTNENQERLFNKQIENYKAKGYSKEDAKKKAAKWVALPGTSEHQLGLSVDIVSLNNQVLDESQEKTEEQKWLMENSYKYGFILRYPSDKSEITGISYEPWHYRYVGKEAAAEITQKGITLEEYLSNI